MLKGRYLSIYKELGTDPTGVNAINIFSYLDFVKSNEGLPGWLDQWSVWLLISESWSWAPNWVQRLLKRKIKKKLMFIYFWETERQSRGGAERERETQNPKQAPGSELSAQSACHGAQTHKPWDHDLSQSQTLNPLSHPGAPNQNHLKQNIL